VRWVEALDPVIAATFRERAGGVGRQRLERALEVAWFSGRPLSWWHAHAPPTAQPLDLLIFVLDLPRQELDRKIDARVLDMIEAGLVEEVERLLQEGYEPSDPGMNATGYIELIPYFRGERTLEEAIREIQRNTRRYARRQLTWFRHQLPPGAIWLDATRPHAVLAEQIAETWRKEQEP